jgi:methyl-accepting chemotaxis protein
MKINLLNKIKFKNLKLINKLTISASVFLLPLGIMLFSFISISSSSIKNDRIELNGIEIMRPAMALMQSIPLYVNAYFDNSGDDIEDIKQHITDLLLELKEKHDEYFLNEVFTVSPQSLIDNWEFLIKTAVRDSFLWAYRQMMLDLNKIIIYVGDISGLITDRDIESAYIIAAAVHELPQAQDRMVLTGNLLRTIQDGAFTQRRKSELQLNLELLMYSDNVRIQNRFHSAETIRNKNINTFESFELLLKSCYNSIDYFSNSAEHVINEPVIDIQVISTLFEMASRANNTIYRLQNASLDRLETIIKGRISLYRMRLTLSLTAAVFAALFAFFITFTTAFNIRKATDSMGVVFKRLNENDMSVIIESVSNDELGEFMALLGDFLSKLQLTFTSINKNSSMVSNAMQDLSSTAQQMEATANQQSASVAEIVSTMENNRNLTAQSAEKTKEVAELAFKTQELSRHGAIIREANESMMFDIRNQNVKIIDIIRNLTDMLSGIDESVKIIDTIADHTKLIAFNAALEASSSGEAGQHFSAIASEIRRFANNVAESSLEIKENVSEIHQAAQTLLTEAKNGSRAIDTGYNRMVEQKEVFENIVDVSQNVAASTQQIFNLSKQQEFAASHVFKALKEISSGVNQFVSATAIPSDTVGKLNIMSNELNGTLAKYHISGDKL